MKISCLFGHKWNGCTCVRCGEKRDEGHNWDLCNGRCRICGKEHPVEHDWKGCKCQRCGKTRDEGHDWDLCNGRCRICGKEHPVEHAWNGCKCTRCGKTRDEGHLWKGTKCQRCGKRRVLPAVHRDKLADYLVDDRMNYGKWKDKPLVWRVLAVEDDRMLLITEDCLEPRAFNKTGPAAWDRCSLREELNGSWFYGSADVFSDAERAAILPVTNDSPGIYYQNKKTWEECYTNKGSEVEDRVFLLSVTEACKYFNANKNGWMNDAMGYKAFEFPMSEALESEKPWWLRNSTRKGAAAVVVTTWGIINYNGFSVTEAYTPQVRPAMWVSRREEKRDGVTAKVTVNASKQPKPKPKVSRAWEPQENMDDAALIEQFESAEDDETRLATLRKIKNEGFHTKIAGGVYAPALRAVAVNHLRDQTLLTDIFQLAGDGEVARAALRKLTDQALLADVARGNAEAETRLIAISRLNDGQVLSDIILDKTQVNAVHRAALDRLMKLKDVSALEKVLRGLPDGVERTNVAGAVKALGSHAADDFIAWQRNISDAHRAQKLDDYYAARGIKSKGAP